MLISWHFLMVFWLRDPTTQFLTPSFWVTWKVLRWYISGPSFMCAWFIVPEFSNLKWFRRSRKYNFRLTLGSFLAITPQNGVRYVSDLDQQCSTRQWFVYVTLFVVLLENVGNSAKKLILWHFLGFFWFTPFYTLWVMPNFLVKWEVSLKYIITVSFISIAFVVVKLYIFKGFCRSRKYKF